MNKLFMRECCAIAAVGCWLVPAQVTAQLDEELAAGAVPLENSISGRDLAVRLRAEVQSTEDDTELVDQDISYARFPSTMYDGDFGLFHSGGASFFYAMSAWENRQGLDYDRSGVKARVPLGAGWKLTWRHLQTREKGAASWDHHYAGVGKTLECGIYTYTQYRHSRRDGYPAADQAYQYLSWKLSDRLRLGADGAFSKYYVSSDANAWHGRLFSTVFLVKDSTSLRTEGTYYNYSGGTSYQDYRAYLYQKLGSSSFARLGGRYYVDSEDLSSQSVNVKLQHYFSARISVHTGYRYYTQSEGADFNTWFAGASFVY